ncbi:MAG: transcription termination/antitermination protein NusG [Kiritimatiellia bacterium]|nr:transcription termination/antitermination protein NusG [Kiritimatiellia bacterium]
MDMQWFVLHTLSGQENRVKESLERRARLEEDLQGLVGDVLIPAERVTETRGNRKTTQTRKFFPGYVLVHLALYDENRQIQEKVWYFIQQTQGLIGFVGGERPVPLRPEEVETILHQVEEKKHKVRPKVMFEPGETIVITEGPFQNFNGVVEEVDPEHGRLKVSVMIFGRSAPVDLEYSQVERGS